MQRTAVSIVIFLLLISVFTSVTANPFATCENPKSFEKWTFLANDVIETLVVVDGFVYLTSGVLVGCPLTLYCLDALSGNQIWNHSAFCFTVANGRVYVGNQEAPRKVYCLDAKSGAELWKVNVTGWVTMVKAIGDFVYVTAGSTVYSFDAETGVEKWSYSDSAGASFRSLSIGDGYVCAVSSSDPWQSVFSTVYAFDSLSGQKIWSYSDKLSSATSLGLLDGKVFISDTVNKKSGGSTNVLALDEKTGAILWKYKPLGTVSDFVISADAIYCTGSLGSIAAVNASTGDVIWNYTEDAQYGSILLAGEYLYVSSTTGASCFRIIDGVRIWGYQASDYNANPAGSKSILDLLPTKPAYADGIIYFGWNGPQGWLDTTEHNFYALDAYTGTVVWKKTLSYSIMATPVVVNQTMYLGCSGVTTISPTYVESGSLLAWNLGVMSGASSVSYLPALTLISLCLVIAVVLLLIFYRKRKLRVKNG